MQVDEEEKVLMSKEELFNKIVTLTGGRSAEELIFGNKTSGASNDIEQATKIAKAMITRFGMSDEFGFVAMEAITNQYLGRDSSLTVSPQTQYHIDQAVQKVVETAHEKAINILKENIEILHEISDYLLRKETITGEEFMEILKKHDDYDQNLEIEESEIEEEKLDQSIEGNSSTNNTDDFDNIDDSQNNTTIL